MDSQKNLNVLGEPLVVCGCDPMTGFYRDGSCRTSQSDAGRHTVCAIMDQSFLDYTKNQGNDLSSRNDEYNFRGLKEGDNWCLCALRWKEAMNAGVAPPLNLNATNKKTLEYVDLNKLKQYKI